MSNTHLALVRKIPVNELKGPARAILMVLADRADEAGTCYPGMAKIGRESGFSRSTVKTALRHLKQSGLITWTQRRNDDGDLSSNLYKITLPRAGGNLGVGREPPHPRAGAGHKAPCKAPSESSNEAPLFSGEELPAIKKNPSNKKHLQELAESIYQEYPRKESKKDGIDAILKSMQSNDPAFLLERVKTYAALIGWKEKRYIPLPATWFNKERFNDDPESWRQPSSQPQKPQTNTPPNLDLGDRKGEETQL